ncbi:MAG TPA: DUF1343 domain-containing protein [Bacteroidota bacterium]|nr:DUF1343 domain-containing protein [Bacteroidota bacterium]
MRFFILLFTFLFNLSLFSQVTNNKNIKVKLGIEEFIENHLDLIKGKNIGIITNHTGKLPDGRHIVDILNGNKDFKIKALFGPEHGIRGDAPDGKSLSHTTDEKTGIPVYSLYGTGNNKPTKEMLKDIDVLIYDIQDIGARFYTFQSTLFLCMEAAAEEKIKFIVLDRPNPITGIRIEGAVLDDSLKSFVGLHKIPVVHGLTIGELAKLVNEEGWLNNGVKADLIVIKMKGWKRNMWYDDTGLPWVKPSPNMMNMNTAIVYPGLCFIEGTNVSEGRGTSNPFEIIGAPFIDKDQFAKTLNSYKLKGVEFEPIKFTPTDILRVTVDPKYDSIECNGIFIHIKDRNKFEPIKTGLYILYTLKKLYSKDFKWRSPSRSTSKYFIDLLAGTKDVRLLIDEGKKPEEIMKRWEKDLQKYNKIRKKYLLY